MPRPTSPPPPLPFPQPLPAKAWVDRVGPAAGGAPNRGPGRPLLRRGARTSVQSGPSPPVFRGYGKAVAAAVALSTLSTSLLRPTRPSVSWQETYFFASRHTPGAKFTRGGGSYNFGGPLLAPKSSDAHRGRGWLLSETLLVCFSLPAVSALVWLPPPPPGVCLGQRRRPWRRRRRRRRHRVSAPRRRRPDHPRAPRARVRGFELAPSSRTCMAWHACVLCLLWASSSVLSCLRWGSSLAQQAADPLLFFARNRADRLRGYISGGRAHALPCCSRMGKLRFFPV